MKTLWEFNDVLRVLGGCSAVARLCNHKPSAITNWRRRTGQFKAHHYFLLRAALAEHDCLPATDLFDFKEHKPDKAA